MHSMFNPSNHYRYILNVKHGYHFLTCGHALEHSLERAFVPGLAAVISFIDVRRNLALIDSRGQISDIWLQIFSECDKLGLQVDQQTQVNITFISEK